MAEVKIIVVKNPLKPTDRASRYEDVIELDRPAMTLADFMTDLFHNVETEFLASVNGRPPVPMEKRGDVWVKAADELTFVPVLAGGGGDGSGKEVLRAISMLAIALGAWYLAPYLVGAQVGGEAAFGSAGWGAISGSTAFAASAVAAGISIVGGMLVNALLPPPTKDNSNATPSVYTWGAPPNTQQQGLPIQWVFGTLRYGGNIVMAYLGLDPWGENQRFNVIDCFGEGPIAAVSDIEINGQPISTIGAFDTGGNFVGLNVGVRLGYLNQPCLDFEATTVSENQQNIPITHAAGPVIFTTEDNQFVGIVVTLTWPQGCYAIDNSDGSVIAGEADYEVDYAPVGSSDWVSATATPVSTIVANYRWSLGQWTDFSCGADNPQGWVEAAAGSSNGADHYEGEPSANPWVDGNWWHWCWGDTVVNGVVPYARAVWATTQGFSITVGFNVPAPNYYQVRVSRTSPDDSGYGQMTAFVWTDVQLNYADGFTRPGRALLGLRGLTSALSSGFSVTALVKGKLVQVWNGSAFVTQYSANNAWVAFFILTQPIFNDDLTVNRYRLRDRSSLPIDSWYAFAQWCDDQVDNGAGGLRPRYEYDGVIDTRQSSWEWALAVCQEAQGTLYYDGLDIKVVIDQPKTPCKTYTVGSTTKSSFKGSFLAIDQRAGQIDWRFLNRNKNYQMDTFTVRDETLALNTDNKVTLTLKGTTDPAQAAAYGNYRLRCNNYLIQSGEMGLDVEALVNTPGDVINIQTDISQWGYGGRLLAADATHVTLDRTVNMLPGVSYEIQVQVWDGTLVTMAVVNNPGSQTVLTIAGAFVTVPHGMETDPEGNGDVYTFGPAGMSAKPFIITAIKPGQENRRTVSLVEYVPDVYTLKTITPINYSALPVGVPSVTNLAAVERFSGSPQGATPTIGITFDIPSSRTWDHAEIWWRSNKQPTWQDAGSTRTGSFSLMSMVVGATYNIAVVSATVNQTQPFSAAPQVSIYMAPPLPPPNVTNFGVSQNGSMVVASWDVLVGFNVASYEIRYNPRGDATWADGTTVTTAEAGSHLVSAKVGPGAWTFMICARDIWGNYSAIPAACDLIITNPNVLMAGGTSEAAKGWPGLYADLGIGAQFEPGTQLEAGSQLEGLVPLTYGFVLHPTGVLIPKSQGLAVNAGWDAFNLAANPVPLCVYTTLELDLPFDVLCRAHGEISSALVPGATGSANPQLQIETKLSGGSYKGFIPWGVGDVTCQAALMQIVLDTSKGVAYIKDFTPTLDAELRTIPFINQAIAIGGTAITYGTPFVLMPNVQATPTGSGSVLAVISNETESGCTVTLYNPATGASVAGNANITIEGV